MKLLEDYKVPFLTKKLDFTVNLPGSKSITNRALLLAALSNTQVTLNNVLFSDDSYHFMESLKSLGFNLTVTEELKKVVVMGEKGLIPRSRAAINVGSAGTAARFLTAMLAASQGEYEVKASEQMQARPMKPLLDALRFLGVVFETSCREDSLPYVIKTAGFKGTKVKIQADRSSQFLSALLMVAPLAQDSLTIEVEGDLIAKPYIIMTLKMMQYFGVKVENQSFQSFLISQGQGYQGRDLQIEPDVSNANYFWAMAFLTGGRGKVSGITQDSWQGDIAFLKVLEKMGGRVEQHPDGISLEGPSQGLFPGIEIDLGDMPDQTMTLAALAPFAQTPTIIRNISVIKYHESNRLQAIINELGKMGLETEELDDGIIIHPGQPRAVAIETYDDHRMAMAFALTGLKVPGMIIKNPRCTAKTFKDYFQVFEGIVK